MNRYRVGENMRETFTTDEHLAEKLDRGDPLARFRERFCVKDGVTYFDGNSLGLLSKDALRSVDRVVGEWKTLAIDGWLGGERPWFYFAERLGEAIAPLIGAAPEEVVATGTTTVNLHALVSTFYEPRGRRTKILADGLTFPSDIYALRSQVLLRGLDPAEDLLLVPSEDGRFLDERIIAKMMGDDVAVAVLPSVLYRSGQLLDIPLLTERAHERGIAIGFDCSHSVGAVPHHFDAWDVDFAFWCSYKYLNGGPGCPAFLYVNRRHFGRGPALAGWFGYVKDRQFEMRIEFEHAKSAGGWQISSPGILGAAPIEGALGIIRDAGIDAIREKSLRMTSYLIYLVDEMLAADPFGFRVGTPREPHRRGGHVALEHDEAERISKALAARGVVGDFRSPNVIRIAPNPLYNTFREVRRLVGHLRDIIDKGECEQFDRAP